MRELTALLVALACTGCGGAEEAVDSGVLDAAHEFAVRPDLKAGPDDLSALVDLTPPPDFSGVSCGTQACAAGQVCCITQSGGTPSYACATSCADGGVVVACDGPDNCRSGSSNLCCGTLFPNGGTAPLCSVTAYSACADTCTTQLPQTCSGDPGTVRFCHRAADCVSDAQNPNCCQFSSGGRDLTFCASSAVKSFAVLCFN
jgi:hypothetical protein